MICLQSIISSYKTQILYKVSRSKNILLKVRKQNAQLKMKSNKRLIAEMRQLSYEYEVNVSEAFSYIRAALPMKASVQNNQYSKTNMYRYPSWNKLQHKVLWWILVGFTYINTMEKSLPKFKPWKKVRSRYLFIYLAKSCFSR